ncbi:hypothetical protein L1987_17888 [Smallanthus sonchifolius]|uniref:Uncharacterized protein n=1 Tax=Smallanthus sonchifolius TaxID=185202 RepID=A0ACB9IZ85_9ASTR|nr:hypothetical protein L1987_17888 [Smallanthus sonchifolius]
MVPFLDSGNPKRTFAFLLPYVCLLFTAALYKPQHQFVPVCGSPLTTVNLLQPVGSDATVANPDQDSNEEQ